MPAIAFWIELCRLERKKHYSISEGTMSSGIQHSKNSNTVLLVEFGWVHVCVIETARNITAVVSQCGGSVKTQRWQSQLRSPASQRGPSVCHQCLALSKMGITLGCNSFLDVSWVNHLKWGVVMAFIISYINCSFSIFKKISM